MNKNLVKIIGLVQGAAGLLGTASAGASSAMQTAQGGDIFNLLSGAALGFLGLKGTASQQKVGLPAVSGLNGLVGLLGLLGANNPLSALQMNNGTGGSLINIAISAIGFIVSFMKNKSAK
ncbi:MAG: hypothetical protein QUS35_07665 [bacterium]|nr:hypothetical protein [bacterium]